ncbi:hypothetical protein GCM10027416_25520 [Okibacterium endophyticum]
MSAAALMPSAGQAERIRGLDIARGLAVLGMFAAHIIQPEPLDLTTPSTWIGIVDGRASILFAVLAGVSIAILSGRRTPATGMALVQARMRITTRGVLIFALGGLLTLLDAGVAVILEYYAVLFVLALPFLRWRPLSLFTLAAVLAVVMPVAQTAAAAFLQNLDSESMISTLLVDGWYPALVWIVFVLVGLGIGRLDLEDGSVQRLVLAIGVGLAAIGYTLGSITATVWGVPESDVRLGTSRWESLWTVAPHSGSPFEVVGSTGFALAVIALCLLVARPLRIVLFPVAAVGQLALTAYSMHIVALFVLQATPEGSPFASLTYSPDTTAIFLWFAVATMICCTLWVLVIGRGPFESLLSSVSRRAASPGRNRAVSADADNPR